MMETQTITISVSKRTLKKIKMIAANRQTTVSELIIEMIEKIADEELGYMQAQKRQIAFLETGYNFGTFGNALAQRDELHRRK